MKKNYIIIPLLVFLVSFLGGVITSSSVDGWYKTINLPDIAPKGSIIGTVWTAIFILSAVSILIFWNKRKDNYLFRTIVWLLIANGLLNILWSALFFGLFHLIGWALVEMIVLNITNLLLIIFLWGRNKISSILFFPYFIWVCFATYLTYLIWVLN